MKGRRVRVALYVVTVAGVAICVAYFLLLRFPEPPVPTLTGALVRGTLRVGDRERTFAYYAPSPLPSHPPLIIALHGAGMTGEIFRWKTGYGFDRAADAHGFVVAYLDGYGHRWNACHRSASFSAHALHIDDVAFVRELIAHFRSRLAVDPANVFVVGASNGGQMAYRLALELATDIRAVAAISASLPDDDDSDCNASGKAISLLIMNGTDDPYNPYAGGVRTLFGFGNRGVVRSSVDSALYFAKLAGMTTPRIERIQGADPSFWVERSTWESLDAVEVVLDTIHGGGHSVPQSYIRYPRILGRTDPDFDGPAEIGRFFARHSR
jgi:polyhydroxybutyrate depolymerase